MWKKLQNKPYYEIFKIILSSLYQIENTNEVNLGTHRVYESERNIFLLHSTFLNVMQDVNHFQNPKNKNICKHLVKRIFHI